jgi:hypothetical protein
MTDDERDERDDEQNDDEQRDDGDDELEQIRSDPGAARKTIEALKNEAGDYRKRLRKAETDLERLKTASMDEHERAVVEAKAEGRREAAAEAGRRLLEARVLAAATGKLHDPHDALVHLKLDDELLELDDGELGSQRPRRRSLARRPHGARRHKGRRRRRFGVAAQGRTARLARRARAR